MLTDEQITQVAELAARHNGGEVAEYSDDIVATREPLESFARLAKGRRVVDGGVILEGVQRAKGQPRTTIYICDFGDARGLYEI